MKHLNILIYMLIVYIRVEKAHNMSAEPFHKLIPGCENDSGFRKKLREDGSGKYAYVVLYTSMEELEWLDYLDEETGIFRYYGDNRQPGRALTDTKKGKFNFRNHIYITK